MRMVDNLNRHRRYLGCMSMFWRNRHISLLAVIWLLALIAVGCGGDKQIGSEDLLDFDEQKNAKRLGEASPTPPPAETKTSEPATGPPKQNQPSPPPPPEENFFDVAMIASSPYFEPGNQLVMTRGVTLRVTNKDNTAERPQRSFTAEDGTFDSGLLKPGQIWTYKFKSGGTWRVIDRNAPFIYATLEVR